MSNEISTLIDNQKLIDTPKRSETNPVTANGRDTGKEAQPTTPGGDNVSLTDTALRIQEVERRLAEVPVVDRERVEQIRQQIADGSYSIRAEHIAGKLIELEHYLGGTN